jgi:hypothetical protein
MNLKKDSKLKTIIYKIKNMIRLNNNDLEYIKTKISIVEKYELIILFNDIAIDKYNMLLLTK